MATWMEIDQQVAKEEAEDRRSAADCSAEEKSPMDLLFEWYPNADEKAKRFTLMIHLEGMLLGEKMLADRIRNLLPNIHGQAREALPAPSGSPII